MSTTYQARKNAMVNPGSFQGLRKDFLVGERQAYAAAVTGGYAKDALAIIQRRFFKRFPIELALNEEPTPEHLEAVDDEEPDPEQAPPNENGLSPEEYVEAVERLKERQKLIVFRKGQIKRWLAYQYMKDHDIDPKDTGAHNPYKVLLHKLTRKGLNRPRLKPAQNVWRKMRTREIEEETKQRAQDTSANMKKLAPIREKVVRDMFKALDLAEREEWAQAAKDEHEEALKKWEADVNGPLSTSPEDRQRCILGLSMFVQPILDMICEATGWKATFVAGGPEPAFEGRLNMISVHSGTTSGDVKMNFGRCEQTRYQKHLVPMYGDFLRKCYSPEDCRACALSIDGEPFDRIADVEHPTEVNIDQIPLATDKRTPSTPESVPSQTKERIQAVREGAQPEVGGPTGVVEGPLIPPPAPISRLPSPAPSPAPSRCPSRQPSPTSPAQQSSEDTRPSNSVPGQIVKEPLATQGQTVAAGQLPSVATSTLEPSRNALVSSVDTPNGAARPSSTPLADVSTSANTVSLAVEVATSPTACQPPGASQEQTDTGANASNIVNASHLAKIPPPKRPRKETTQPPAESRKWKHAESLAVDVVDPNGPADVRLSKRICNDANSSHRTPANSPSAVPSTSNARDWFEKVKGQFKSASLGEVWLKLLEEWEAFQEEENAYTDTRVLPAKCRPKSVAMWIGRARAPSWRPSNPNLKADEADFKAWWATLQPGWRIADGKVVTRSMEGDWSSLRLPGVNGVQSIIAALFFWGLGTSSKPQTQKVWATTVRDCTKVFSRLRSHHPSSS